MNNITIIKQTIDNILAATFIVLSSDDNLYIMSEKDIKSRATKI